MPAMESSSTITSRVVARTADAVPLDPARALRLRPQDMANIHVDSVPRHRSGVVAASVHLGCPFAGVQGFPLPGGRSSTPATTCCGGPHR
jgi:hypothetical protein